MRFGIIYVSEYWSAQIHYMHSCLKKKKHGLVFAFFKINRQKHSSSFTAVHAACMTRRNAKPYRYFSLDFDVNISLLVFLTFFFFSVILIIVVCMRQFQPYALFFVSTRRNVSIYKGPRIHVIVSMRQCVFSGDIFLSYYI